MPKICPNCLRLVRTGANYCGFCGTSLNPPALDDTEGVLSLEAEGAGTDEIVNEAAVTEAAPKSSRIRRTILIVIIILLCLVLLTAFVVHYWPVISEYVIPLINNLRRP
jgi:hypothetical protein